MDRLTGERLDYEMMFCNECPYYYGEPNGCNRPNLSCEAFGYFTSVYEKLQKLEDAEEQGRLAELPIAVGKIIYAVGRDIEEYKISHLSYCVVWSKGMGEMSSMPVGIIEQSLGETVFLTEAEAQAALERMEASK